MTTLTPKEQLQKIGITYESIILILLPTAQSIPLLFHNEETELTSTQKISIFISFCIAGFNFCAQVACAFLKHKRRASIIQRIIRILVWVLTVVNIVENQIMNLNSESGLENNIILAYSIMGLYIFAIIQLLSIQGQRVKKVIICFNVLYFSLRIAISYHEPILGVFAGILCLVIVRFLMVVTKLKSREPEKSYNKDLETFLFKALLADSEEGVIVLQNNRSVYYANQRANTLLENASGDLITDLEQLQSFEALSDNDQLDLKEKIFESFLAKVNPEDQPKYKSTRFPVGTFSRDDMSLESQGFSSEQLIGHRNKENIQGYQARKAKSLFSTENKKILAKQGSHASMSTSKFRLLPGKTESMKGRTFSTKKTTLTDLRPCFESLGSSDQNEDFLYMGDKNIKKTSLQKENNDGCIFKDGIPSNLNKLFITLKTNNIPDIDSPTNQDNPLIKGSSDNFLSQQIAYIKHSDDQFQLLEIKIQPLYFDKQPFLIVRLNDITEKECCRLLKNSEKERTQILSSVTHELRTPLNCIITMLDIVQAYISEDLKADYIHPASYSAKLLLSLVNDILDFSQSKAKTLKLVYSHFNLRQNLLSVLKLMDIQAKGKGLTLALEYDEQVPEKIHSEPNRLRQIIINLIGNALKFTLKGEILLKVEYHRANVIGISVSDTGVGIKAENLNGLFRRFSKVDDTSHINQQGVGLGLSISNMLAKLLSPDGKGINVDSVYGQGTTFSFEIESKPMLDISERLEFNLSSEEDDDPRNVVENITEFKNQNESAQNQKLKLFSQRKASLYGARTSIFSKNNYSLSNLGMEKENLLGSLVQPSSSKNEVASSQQALKESRSALNLAIPATNISSNNKVDPNPLGFKTFRSIPSYEDPLPSIERRGTIRSKSVIEREGYAKIMEIREQKKKFVEEISRKISRESKLPCILIVDDNSFNIIAFKRILESMDFKVDTAVNGELAIEKILERKEKSQGNKDNYRIVFIDCYMPIKNGFETANEIRKLEQDGVIHKVPIVAVTASSSPRDLKKCYDVGMNDYLAKPINVDALKDVLIKHLKGDI